MRFSLLLLALCAASAHAQHVPYVGPPLLHEQASEARFAPSLRASGDANGWTHITDPGGRGQLWTRFGETMAVDGEWIAFGASGDGLGAVHLFRRQPDGSYAHHTRLALPGDTLGGPNGVSVALDGTRALVGAAYEDNYRGAAYLFSFDGTAWALEHRFVAPDRKGFESFADQGDKFGHAVAFAGGRVAVSTFPNNAWAGEREAVYVFGKTSGAWQQEARLAPGGSPDPGTPDGNGFGVALDGDATVLAIGAYADRSGGNAASGAVYLYTPGAWAAPQRVGVSGSVAVQVGHAVALDGDRVLVGTAGDALVVERTAQGWAHTATLASSRSRVGVALAGDLAVVGDAQEVRTYVRNGAAWTPVGALVRPENAPSFPNGGIATDGADVWVGAYRESAAYRYTPSAAVPQRVALGAEHPAGDWFGSSVALKDGLLVVGAPYADRRTGETHTYGDTQGKIVTYRKSGGTWNVESTIWGGEIGEDAVGSSVALSDTWLVTRGGDGSVWEYRRDGGAWNLMGGSGTHPDDASRDIALRGNTLLIAGLSGKSPRTMAWSCAATCAPRQILSTADVRRVALSPDARLALAASWTEVRAYRDENGRWTDDGTLFSDPNVSITGLAMSDTRAVFIKDGWRASTGDARLLIYERRAAGWEREADITLPSDGYYYSLAFDGDRAVVNSGYANSALVYTRSGSTWALTETIAGPPQDYDGWNIAPLALEGTTLVWGESAAQNFAGAVYVRELDTSTPVEKGETVAETGLRLRGANPFSASTTLAVDLAAPAPVRLVLYDALGREVRVLHDGPLAPGTHVFTVDGSGLSSGVYLARLVAGTQAHTLALVYAAR